MKILFLIPEYLSGRSFLQPPIDILLIDKILKEKDWESDLIDNRIEKLPLKELVKKIKKINPNILLVTTSPYDVSQNYFVEFRIYVAEKTIFYLKQNFPTIPMIITGPHGSVRPDILLKDIKYSADIIIQWEYDITLPQVLEVLKSYEFNIKKATKKLKEIPNLIIIKKHKLNKNIKIIKTGYSEKLAHPENYLIIPRLKLIEKYKNKYFGDRYEDNKYKKVNKFGIVLFQRGCPFNCTFCFKFLGNWRRFNNGCKEDFFKAVAEWKKFGYKDLFVADYVFGLTDEYLKLFVELSKKFSDVRFYIQTRADLINENTIDFYNQINIGFIWLGIESFSNKIQKNIKKYDNVNKIFKALKILKENKLNFGGFVQFGLPGETTKSINRTLFYINKLKIPYTPSIILHTPLYGTETYLWAKKQYPYIGNNWSDISSIRGLVKNKISPSTLLELVRLLRKHKK